MKEEKAGLAWTRLLSIRVPYGFDQKCRQGILLIDNERIKQQITDTVPDKDFRSGFNPDCDNT